MSEERDELARPFEEEERLNRVQCKAVSLHPAPNPERRGEIRKERPTQSNLLGDRFANLADLLFAKLADSRVGGLYLS